MKIILTLIFLSLITNSTNDFPMIYDHFKDKWVEVITPYNLNANHSDPMNAFASSEWLDGVKKCTDIWQETHNETLYYRCFNPLNEKYD